MRKNRVTAVACRCLTGLGLRQFMLQDDSFDNYVPLWITLFNIILFLVLFNKIMLLDITWHVRHKLKKM